MNSDESLRKALREEIHVVPYDPVWQQKFNAEKKRLLAFFADSLIEIEHIGSTAVPHLSAKPIIDIMASVASLKTAQSILIPLCGYGYVTSDAFNAGLTERLWLLRHSGGHRTHHLHLVEHHSYGWTTTLKFRDALRGDPELAGRYQALKLDLAEHVGNDRDFYAKAKSKFIEAVIAAQR